MRIALFAIALAIAAPVRAQTVNETFDRISGERMVAYTADGSMDTARPVVTFEASFIGGAASSAIRLAFVSANGASRFSACHGIGWFVDGQSLPAGPESYRGSVVDGEMIELIDQAVTAQWAAAIGNAQEARYRVCRDDYALTPRDIEAFARIAAKLKGAALSPSATRASAPAAAAGTEVDYKGMNWRPKHQGIMFPSRK
ncbi:MAG: hypothetical protein ACREO0_01825 [Pseudoxanthomonas sp.]